MEEDIKRLEEIVDIYYDCAGNKEQDYDMRVDIGFMKREAQALENLIKGYREQKEIIESLIWQSNFDMKILEEDYVPKSKIKEEIEPVINSLEKNGFVGYADKLRDIMSELMEDK